MARVSVAVHTRVWVGVGAGGGSAAAVVLFLAVMIAVSSRGAESHSTTVGPVSTVTLPSRLPPNVPEDVPEQPTSGPPSRGETVHASGVTVSCSVSGRQLSVRMVNDSAKRRNFHVLVNLRSATGRYLSDDVATFRSIEPGRAANITLPNPPVSRSVSCRIRAVSGF